MRTLVVLFLFCFSTARGQEITVRSFKGGDVDFRKYQRFFWAAQVDNQSDESGYFNGDLFLKADIREAVHEELGIRGLVRSERDPQLLVNFRIFDNGALLTGSGGYGYSYWKREEIIYSLEFSSDEIEVDPGTLIISLLDKDTGRIVWQGFASGLAKDKDEGLVRDAVRLIFEQYRSSEYTRR